MLKTKPIIYDTYNEEIYPEIESLEGFRRDLLNKVLFRGALIPILGIGIGVFCYKDTFDITISAIIAIVFSLLFMYTNFAFPPEQKIFREELKNFYEDISIIFELVEYFKLDTKIGL